ncbi:MAG: hypothetical protein WDM78_04385 [Puia sp.]
MNKGIVKEGILGVLKLRWNALFKNYRKRVKNIPIVGTVIISPRTWWWKENNLSLPSS